METILFNTMEPDADESLSEFHQRLLKQADKCLFLCTDCKVSYKQRMIRDRLILVVNKDLRNEILSRNVNPTTEEILRMSKENLSF